jgi:DNA-binding PadR family transcriptional regulator
MLDLTLLQLKVLWLINKKDSCGYELMSSLGRGKKKITQGTMYPLLQSLEKEKWIEPETSGKRGKKCYSITPTGKKILQKACKEFCSIYNDIFKEFVCEVCGRKV